MQSGSGSKRWLLVLVAAIATLTSGDRRFCAGAPLQAADSAARTLVRGLSGASALAVTPSGTLYVLERVSGRLTRFSPGGVREKEAGGFGWEEEGFDGPADVTALTDLEVFVADYGNDRIVRLDRSLGVASSFETRSENVTFRFPRSVALTTSGRLLVVDGEFGRIVELGRDDRITKVFGGSGGGRGFLRRPVRVRADGDRRVLVLDESGIVVFDAFGSWLRTIGRAVTGPVISFDAAGEGVALLDSSSVRIFPPAGGPPRRIPLEPGGGAPPVDLRTAGEWIYVLYPDRVVRLPVPPAEPEGP